MLGQTSKSSKLSKFYIVNKHHFNVFFFINNDISTRQIVELLSYKFCIMMLLFLQLSSLIYRCLIFVCELLQQTNRAFC